MTSLCDCCADPTERTHGYVLATQTVVISEGFWRTNFQLLKQVSAAVSQDEAYRLRLFDLTLRRLAGSTSPWLICERCIDLFACDRAEARAVARSGGTPADSGAVDPGECCTIAAIVWEGTFGRWPSTVRQPTVRDSCDFCGRKIYAGEICGTTRRGAVDELRAAGTLEYPPLGPARGDSNGWLSCQACTVRTISQVMRAREKQGL